MPTFTIQTDNAKVTCLNNIHLPLEMHFQIRLPLSIVLLFSMLWLPLGQYDFLLDNWMKIGTYAVPFLLIGAFAFTEKSTYQQLLIDHRFISTVMLIAYILHQYEEHWIDVFGNYYAFYDFNNNFILHALGKPESTIRPLTKASILMINTSLVWLVGAMAIWKSPKHLFPSIAMASIIVVNGLVHILAAIVNWTYNPGLLTSIVIFVPLYFLFIQYVLSTSIAYKKQIISGVAWAFLAHVIMVVGLLMANWFKLFPEMVYFILLVIWSLVPLLFFRNANQ
ncbi:MAG: HXXEE domain-containing protein [Bacteroidota bacterium]